MAFDGITIANLACELKKTLEGGKIGSLTVKYSKTHSQAA